MTTDTPHAANEPTPATVAAQLDPVLRSLADLLDGVTPDQASAPTPCTEMDLATLRAHVVGWLTAFTDGYASPDGRCTDPEAVTVTGTGAGQVRDQADRLSTILPEATDRPLWIGEAAMPGDLALRMILWEYQVHGWDLAAASGQPWHPDDAGLAGSLAFAPGMLTPDFQGEGKTFGPPVDVAPGAPALDRLVGLSGRDPKWSAR